MIGSISPIRHAARGRPPPNSARGFHSDFPLVPTVDFIHMYTYLGKLLQESRIMESNSFSLFSLFPFPFSPFSPPLRPFPPKFSAKEGSKRETGEGKSHDEHEGVRTGIKNGPKKSHFALLQL
jgi:hypothetical protein